MISALKWRSETVSFKRLSEDEAVELIVSLLRTASQPLTTREIEEKTRKRRVSCPDRTPVFLNRLRLRGVVKGQLSVERRAWIWWVET
ncbi:MAG: hypothetical protein JSW29_00320 [Candidatus Bathyarchaeota archaeon]|nr:MAG: hypothetical protein JSW29_00320 [Candidatus Bathyarchaeota archaeon]